MAEDAGTRQKIEEVSEEIRGLKRAVYGNPELRQQGLFDRIDHLEAKHQELLRTYEREKIEKEHFESLEKKVDTLLVDQRINSVKLTAVVAGMGTVGTGVVIAIIVAVIRYLAGGGV